MVANQWDEEREEQQQQQQHHHHLLRMDVDHVEDEDMFDDIDVDEDEEEDYYDEEEEEDETVVVQSAFRDNDTSVIDLSDRDMTNDGARLVANGLVRLNNNADLTTPTSNKDIVGCHNNNSNNNHTCCVSQLNLGSNAISDDGAIALAAALPYAKGLRLLELGRNDIGTRGTVALARALRTTPSSLTYLSLQFNGVMKRDGYLAWADTLRINQTLHTLFLCTSYMGDEGVVTLASALAHNQALENFWICNNNITPVGAKALAKALTTNQRLRLLSMDGNHIEDEGAQHLAHTLRYHNNTLQELYVRDNGVNDPGTHAIAQAVVQNHSLINIFTGHSHLYPREMSKAEKQLQLLVQWNKRKLYRLFQEPNHAVYPILLFKLLNSKPGRSRPYFDECLYWIKNKPEVFMRTADN